MQQLGIRFKKNKKIVVCVSKNQARAGPPDCQGIARWVLRLGALLLNLKKLVLSSFSDHETYWIIDHICYPRMKNYNRKKIDLLQTREANFFPKKVEVEEKE